LNNVRVASALAAAALDNRFEHPAATSSSQPFRPSNSRKTCLGASLAEALLGPRRVSARQGWAGEKSGLFEHPAGTHYLCDSCFLIPHNSSRAFVRCGGFIWAKARPWAKSLSWQTQGGRVK